MVFATSAAGQVEDAAAQFVAALTANDIAAFDAITGGASALESLSDVREALERYDCIEVSSYRTTVMAPNRIRIDLDATATTHGRNHGRVPFPRGWVVDLACDGKCRVTRATRVEEFAAGELASQPSSEWQSYVMEMDLEEGPFLRALTKAGGPAHRAAFDFALQRAAANGDAGVQVWGMGSLALALRDTDPAGALAILRRALELARRAGDIDEEARTHFLIGTTLWVGHRPVEGFGELDEASAMIGRLDDPRIALKAMAMHSFIAQQAGDMRAAISSAKELNVNSRRYHWPQGEASAGLYLGSVHASMGNAPAASFYFHGALRKAREAREGRLIAMALDDCAEVESARHHYGTAIALMRSIGALDRTDIKNADRAIHNAQLASFYRMAGRLVEAREAFEIASASLPDWNDGGLRARILQESSALRQAEGDLQGALADALEGLNFDKKGSVVITGMPSAELQVRAAQVQIALGHDAAAIASLREAVSIVESDRSAYAGGAMSSELFMETGADAYRTLIDLLVRHGRTREAFEVSERMRGRALGDVLAQGKVDVSASLTAAEREKEQALERADDPAIAAAKREEARAELARFETELFLIHPSLRLRRPLKNDFRARMPAKLDGGIIIEYVVMPSRMVVFTVTAAAVKAHVIAVSQKEIERRVTRLTAAIARRDYGYAAQARAVYALLLKPIAGELRGKRAVIIVPDRALWRIPFQALLDDDDRPLIESAAVSYAPSLATLRLALERRQRLAQRTPSIAAISNSSVPEADREVRTIAALYGRGKVELGSKATPEQFPRDAAGASVVHIAAHAVIDDGAPMYSALMLAPEKHNDGALEARAIANLSLQAHTAVLAACETAGGGVGSGEGITGLAWAFLLAGRPTTVASQWKTSSAPTATVMIDFHRHLVRGSDPAESLRQAELALARDPRYRHPYYWAAFVVMGAP
jgi:pentatricopeptide repeat protein